MKNSWLVMAVLLFVGFSLMLEYQTIENQHAFMKEAFHRDGIALVSLFGNHGLERLYDPETTLEDLSVQERFATGLLLQRYVVAYWIRDAFTDAEWEQMVLADGRQVMKLPLLRKRWKQVSKWYPERIRDFFEQELMNVGPF